MPESHHRKKHKEHLRQFRHRQENAGSITKTKAATIFTIAGAVIGVAAGYFSTNSSLLWAFSAGIAVAIAGYFFGRNIDRLGRK